VSSRKAAFVAFTLGILCGPLVAGAQPGARVARVGILWVAGASEISHFHEAFRRGLGELGYVEGQTIAVEARYGEGRTERLPALVADLLRLKVDVIVAPSAQAVVAAKQATSTVPIVMSNVADPVGLGFVATLARPGGNITGLSNLAPELSGKSLELLKEALPRISRVAVLWNAANPAAELYRRETQAAARALGLQLHMLEVRVAGEFEKALADTLKQRADALLVLGAGDPLTFLHRKQIIDLGAKHRVPTMYGVTTPGGHVEAGALMAYGPSTLDMFRRIAFFVDKILKGAKPGDIPIEQPTKFELLINLKTAKALGLTIPPSVLFRADEVIQ